MRVFGLVTVFLLACASCSDASAPDASARKAGSDPEGSSGSNQVGGSATGDAGAGSGDAEPVVPPGPKMADVFVAVGHMLIDQCAQPMEMGEALRAADELGSASLGGDAAVERLAELADRQAADRGQRAQRAEAAFPRFGQGQPRAQALRHPGPVVDDVPSG